MTDIVERLRDRGSIPPTREEAADEIERLREQEQKMTNHAINRMAEIDLLREERDNLKDMVRSIIKLIAQKLEEKE